MEDKLYLEHDFIKIGLTSFLKSCDNLFEHYLKHINNDTFPIFIRNTGDDIFLSNYSDNGKNKKEHYDLVPRMVFGVGGVSVDVTQLSARAIPSRIQLYNDSGDKVSGTTHLRRIPLRITMPVSVVFSKIHEFFTWLEYYLTSISHTKHTFMFNYAGSTHTGVASFVWDYESETNFELQFGGDKKERKLPLIIEIDLQFPAFNIYEAKNFNYFEDVGVIIDDGDYGGENGNGGGNGGACNECGSENCGTCGDPNKGRGMIKIIHNTFFNEYSPNGHISTQIIEPKKE